VRHGAAWDDPIVVTGIGAVCAIGSSAGESFEALIAGRTGIASVEPALSDEFPCRLAAQVKHIDDSKILGGKESVRHARFTRMAAMIAAEAASDAGLSEMPYERERIGCFIGVGLFGTDVVEHNARLLADHGPRRVWGLAIPSLISNMATSMICQGLDIRGPSYCVTTACASGAHAIMAAADQLRLGRVDCVVAGGVEAAVTPLGIACLARMQAVSRRNHDPARACRPFDKDRDGFVLGEGGGVLVLERASAARRRGARVRAVLAGYGASTDAHHPVQPHPEGRGAEAAMRAALEDARIGPDAVGYVNAHGTATVPSDIMESAAIRRVFGAHTEHVWVGSTKAATGHLIGGAGGLEAVVAIESLRCNVVPPTLNLDEPGEGCDLRYVAHQPQDVRLRYALSNNFGIGGQNASIIFGRPD
jgi:3-oxoacyl-[acyl-carrier-protein] synthase II